MRAFYIAVAVVGLGVGAVAAYLAGRAPSDSGGSGEFVSGPQIGAKVPGAFEPLHVNGPDRGDEACVFCKYGNSPVVMIFAQKPSDALAVLVRKVEKAAAEAIGGEVGACVVVTDTSDATKAALTKLADKENLKHVILAVIEPQKLKRYALHSDAEVTALLYSKQVVRANHAFKAGELTEKIVGEIADEAANLYAGK